MFEGEMSKKPTISLHDKREREQAADVIQRIDAAVARTLALYIQQLEPRAPTASPHEEALQRPRRVA